MREIRKPRRRWRRLLLAILALLICLPIAWHFRPLNSAERQLVGIWVTFGERDTLRLEPNRRFYSDGEHVGDWSASATTLSIKWSVKFGDLEDRSWPARLLTYSRWRLLARHYELTWEDPDRIVVFDNYYDRVPPDAGR